MTGRKISIILVTLVTFLILSVPVLSVTSFASSSDLEIESVPVSSSEDNVLFFTSYATGPCVPFAYDDVGLPIYGNIATENADVSITMRTGDSFNYDVLTNITATISASGTAMEWLSLSGNTLSGVPESTGSYTCLITAKCNSFGVEQTATQTISFTIYDRVQINELTADASLLVGASSGSKVYSFINGIDWNAPAGYDLMFKVLDENNNNSSLFSYNQSTGLLTTTKSISDSDIGTYTAFWTVSFNPDGYKAADVQTHTLTISVYSDLSITSDTTIYTYVGHGNQVYSLTTNHDDWENLSKSFTIPSSISSFVTQSNGSLSFNFNSYDVKDSDFCDTYEIPMTAGISGLTSAESILTIHIYDSLEFTSDPVLDSTVSVSKSSSSPLDVALSFTASGASDLRIYWGDGTFSDMDVQSGNPITYTAKHNYDSSDEYIIAICSTNDNGSSRATILYSAFSDGGFPLSGAVEETKSFFEDHGYVFAIALVVGFIGLFAYALGFRDIRILAAAAISIVTGLIMYFGGITL